MRALHWLWKKYSILFTTEWAMMLAYRAESIIWMIGALVQPFVSMAIWLTISIQAGGSIGGYNQNDFIVYFLGVMVVERLTRAWNVWNLENDIREGTFTPKLLRPFNPVHWEINQNLVYKFFYAVLLAPTWVLVAWIFPETRIQVDLVSMGWFLIAILISSVLRFVICHLFGMMSFWTSRALSMYMVFEMLHFFLAGRIAPMSLFPAWLSEMNQWLPFYGSVGLPVDLISGRLMGHTDLIIQGILVLTAWTVALIGLSVWQWRAGLKQYGAIGG